MKVQLAHILQNLFNASSLDEVSLDKLQEIVKDHPYFSTAHFLLAQKLKLDESEQYGTAIQRTALYFHDPLWLRWQLDQEKKETVIHSTHVSPTLVQQPATLPGEKDAASPVEDQVEQSIEERIERLTQTLPVEQSELERTAVNEAPLQTDIAIQDDIPAQDEAQIENRPTISDGLEQSTMSGDFDQGSVQAQEWEHPAEVANEELIPPINDNQIDEEAIDEIPDQSSDPSTETLIETPDDRDSSAEFRSVTPDGYETVEESTANAQHEHPQEKAMPVEDETQQSSELLTARPDHIEVSESVAPITRPSHQTLTPEPVSESSTPAFDPYYTIDYFASQGIKIPTDIQPGDKLGKQLKSFTEWLKTMKRLPQPQIEDQTDETEQQHIRQFAAGSLEKKEVVTETMAEVLIKQDKKGEAIAIYEKLSLLDPSKRAYFAAKIENLKSDLI